MGITNLIRWCDSNRVIVFLVVAFLAALGFLSVREIPLDAIPDLSDTQVIVFSEWNGRSPDLVEDQITYPIVSALVAAPGVKVARGVSYFGLSFVYVLFDDGTDPYWARNRVLEYISRVQGQLPNGVIPTLGPDATGVGWGFQYVLEDKSGKHTLQELRSFQDWYLRYWIESVPGVAEVASIGGFVKQYQVTLDPVRLLAHNIPLHDVVRAVQRSNNDVGGRIVEMGGREYIVRGRGYVTQPTDLEHAVVRVVDGVPITIADLGEVQIGPEIRRGAAEWNGEGEVVGGIVVVRQGEDVRKVIDRVKARIAEVSPSLPAGVELKTAYDRSRLIDRSIATLKQALLEESLIVAAICMLFLWHLPSALVAILTLPLAVLLSFILMRHFGIGLNIMSLGGIAIAIGDLIDSAIVMVENAHKRIEERPDDPRREVVLAAAQEVGRPLFYSLLITTVSFLPVFALQAQEGRLFAPLAWAKTFSMAWAAILAVTIVPPLMVLLIRGRIRTEGSNPLNRSIAAIYEPVARKALRFRRTTVLLAILIVVASVPLFGRLGSEFMPPLNEGSILYMPTTLPGVSIAEATQLMHTQDKLIRQVHEVDTVFGKVGRARTATDPAPLSMLETTIVLKPREQWRPGVTWDDIIEELDEVVQFPGVTNAWTMPIRGRVDMLTTGIRTPVGIKILGPDLGTIQQIGQQIEGMLVDVPGTRSVFSERVLGGTFLDFTVDRFAAARYGLNVEDVEQVIETAVGGMSIDTTIEGPERYPVNVRYFADYRSDLASLEQVAVPTPTGAQVPLGTLASIAFVDGPVAIRNENGARSGWVFVDVDQSDIGGYVARARTAVANLSLPAGYALEWSGQYEYMQRASKRLAVAVPATILLVLLLLFMNFRSGVRVAMVFLTIPFALSGSFAFLLVSGYNLSVAVWVGMIALAGVATETGVLMVEYLDEAWSRFRQRSGNGPWSAAELDQVVLQGAVRRVRPKMMTVLSTMLGLAPIMWATGTGADVMKRLAAPMIGGMVSSTILTLILLPVLYRIWLGWAYRSNLQSISSSSVPPPVQSPRLPRE